MGLINRIKSMFVGAEPKEKEIWKLVTTIKYPSGISRGKKGDADYASGELYFHFFESNLGNRCIGPKCTIQDAGIEKLHKFVKSSDMYNEKLYRWLMGRGDPDILRYDEVDQEEIIHYLKGTISEAIPPEDAITKDS